VKVHVPAWALNEQLRIDSVLAAAVIYD
jgi:hypothetical protein